eukprot:tig00000263_g23270.t1
MPTSYPPPPRSDRSWSIADVYEYAPSKSDWIERPKKVFTTTTRRSFKWFEGGKLNVSALLLDRHVKSGKADKPAIFWEGEPEADRRTLTFGELHQQASPPRRRPGPPAPRTRSPALTRRGARRWKKFAGVLRHKFGVKKGDRVVVYMPQVPETVVALLACARLGAPYCIVFGGFSDEGCGSASATSGPRWPAPPTDCVENVIVLRRRPVDANDTLFVMHTSGSKGKPKGAHEHVRPLALGVTTVQYEASSRRRTPAVCGVCERYKEPEKYDLSSIRVIGSAGEPIGPVAWHWFHKKVGGGKAPSRTTGGQTETGGPTISSIPGATPQARLRNRAARHHEPLPSMLRTLYNADKRFGYIWITGRVDDVINVAGHRMGTAEIEAAINHCSLVAESASSPAPTHQGRGRRRVRRPQGWRGHRTQKEVDKAVHEMVYHHIGKIAHLDTLIVVPGCRRRGRGR